MAVALLLYHRLWVAPALSISMLDLAEVYRKQEAAFTRKVAEARTDRERDAALEQVTAFAQRLSVALDELPPARPDRRAAAQGDATINRLPMRPIPRAGVCRR